MDRSTPTLFDPRPDLSQVANWMVRLATKGSTDLSVRQRVETICKDLVPGDYASEILAIYYWVCSNIRYMRDIYDVEFLKEPWQTLETQSGDCDDIATLLAAMLMAAGNHCAFVVVSFKRPPIPSHVLVAVDTPGGPVWLDPVANRNTDQMVRRVTGKRIVPVGGPEGNYDAFGSTGPGPVKPTRLVFSVYDYRNRRYQYFEAPAEVPASGWFRRPNGRKLVPERLAVALPAGARPVGTGPNAMGVIAVAEPGLGSPDVGLPLSSPWPLALFLAFWAYVFGRWSGSRSS